MYILMYSEKLDVKLCHVVSLSSNLPDIAISFSKVDEPIYTLSVLHSHKTGCCQILIFQVFYF